MLDRVLHQLLQLDLDILQTSDVFPGDVRYFDSRLAQSTRVALAKRPLKKKIL